MNLLDVNVIQIPYLLANGGFAGDVRSPEPVIAKDVEQRGRGVALAQGIGEYIPNQ